jgi:outer membrane protein TolC
MRYVLVLVPFLGWSMGFNEYSERVYRHSEESIAQTGRMEALGYERAAMMSGEPLSLEASSRRIRADDPADNGMEYGVMVDWTFKMPRLKEAQAGEWDVLNENIRQGNELLRHKIEVELKHEWLLAQAAADRAAIFSDKEENAAEAYETGLKQHQAGRLSRMELVRLETEACRAKAEKTKAMMEAEHFQHRLRERAMMKEPVIIGDMSFHVFSDKARLPALVNTAPSVQTVQMRLNEIEAQIKTLRRSRVESLSLGAGMTQEPTQKSFDFRVSIPLSSKERNDHKIAALMSERSALVHQKEVTAEKLRIRIEALSEHLTERERLLQEAQNGEKQYAALFAMAHKAREGGVMGQFEYLATKNTYYDARLRTIEIREQYINEMNEIEEKLGRIAE